MNDSNNRFLRIPGRRFKITKRMIEDAVQATKSNSEAARWLGIAFNTYKKHSSYWGLYEEHKNQAGKGIHKVIQDSKYSIDGILDGQYPKYPTKRLMKRLIDAGYLPNECSVCKWNEERITDGKLCLHMDYIDGNEENKEYDNLRLLCPNCYFTNIGDFLNAKKFC